MLWCGGIKMGELLGLNKLVRKASSWLSIIWTVPQQFGGRCLGEEYGQNKILKKTLPSPFIATVAEGKHLQQETHSCQMQNGVVQALVHTSCNQVL